MAVDIATVKELRDKTGFSFAEISKALEESGGNREKAIDILKSKGAHVAEKKASRSTGEGVVDSYIHATHKIGALVALKCETDFVARNPQFTELAHNLALHIAATNPSSQDELMAQEFIKDPSITIADLMHGVVAKLGENIKLEHFTRFEI